MECERNNMVLGDDIMFCNLNNDSAIKNILKEDDNMDMMGQSMKFNEKTINISEHNAVNVGQNVISSMNNKNGRVDVRSYQELLFESVGKFVVCRFLIGTEQLMTATGILKNVGKDYFVLEDPCTGMMTACDLYSVKFVSVLSDEFTPSIPSYCRRRLYENMPIFSNGF